MELVRLVLLDAGLEVVAHLQHAVRVSESGVVLRLQHCLDLVDIQVFEELLRHLGFQIKLLLAESVAVLDVDLLLRQLKALPVRIALHAPLPQKLSEQGVFVADFKKILLLN